MQEEKCVYKRLPGKGSRLFYTHTLWQGSDHLLRRDVSFVSEDLKRFYFKDIQAIILERKDPRDLRNWGTGLLAAGFLFMAYSTEGGWSIFWCVLSSLLFLLLALSLWSGARCICYIATAVQSETLPSLERLRNAERVLKVLRPLIEEAQGRMPQETEEPSPGNPRS